MKIKRDTLLIVLCVVFFLLVQNEIIALQMEQIFNHLAKALVESNLPEGEMMMANAFVNLDGKYQDYRHTKEELEDFINRLNYNIQYLGLNKEEVIEIANSLYRE